MKKYFIFVTFAAFAFPHLSFANNCTVRESSFPREGNFGFAVGENCSNLTFISEADVILKLLPNEPQDQDECSLISNTSINGRSVLLIKMDSSKENTMTGVGCKIKTIRHNGDREIYIQANET